MITTSSPDVRHDKRAQFRRDLGPEPEPALETRHRLMQQHAKTVHGFQAALVAQRQEAASAAERRRCRSRERARAAWPRSRNLAASPCMPSEVVLTSKSASPSNSGSASQRCAGDAAPKRSASSTARSTVRLTMRMSLNTALLQGEDDRARRAACAENHGAPAFVPARSLLVEIGGKTIGIGVAAMDHAILQPERVDGADQLGRLIAAVDRGEGRLLVGNGDVAADKTLVGKLGRRNSRNRPARCRSPRSEPAMPNCLQPMTMDHRRARMRDRVPADKCLLAGFSHRSLPAHASAASRAAAAVRQW